MSFSEKVDHISPAGAAPNASDGGGQLCLARADMADRHVEHLGAFLLAAQAVVAHALEPGGEGGANPKRESIGIGAIVGVVLLYLVWPADALRAIAALGLIAAGVMMTARFLTAREQSLVRLVVSELRSPKVISE